MTETLQKLLLAMAFAGFMGAAFGAAFGLAIQATDVPLSEQEGEGQANE